MSAAARETQSESGGRPQRRPPGWTLDALLVSLIATLAGLVGISRVHDQPGYLRGDILTQFMPLYGAVADRLRAGHLPGWNPALFSGMPLAGDPISGWTYLPANLLFLLFDAVAAYQIHIVLHLVLAGVATYALGRAIGLSPFGAATAGLSFAFGPLLRFTSCCNARMQLSPWIPLGILGAEMAVRAKNRPARLAWCGATGLVMSQMLAGYFGKGAYYGILVIGSYIGYRALIDPPEGRRSLRRRLTGVGEIGTATLAFGASLSAASVLPKLDFSTRANLEGGSYANVTSGPTVVNWSTLDKSLANLLDPDLLKYDIGAVTFALAVAGVALAGRRFRAPYFVALAVVVLALTLSPNPVHWVLYLLPRFQVLHEHGSDRSLVAFNIAPAMLAGAAVTALERPFRRAAWMLAPAAVPVATAVILLLTFRHGDLPIDPRMARQFVLVSAALGLGGIALQLGDRHRMAAVARLSRIVLPAALAALVFWSAAGSALAKVWPVWQGGGADAITRAYAADREPGQASAFLQDQAAVIGPFRYLGYDSDLLRRGVTRGRVYYHGFEERPEVAALLVGNRALPLGLNDIQGYNPVHNQRYVELIDAINGRRQAYHETDILPTGLDSPLLDVLDARYLVVPAATPPGRPDLFRLSQRYPTVFRDDRARVLDLGDRLPHAWIVHDVVRVEPGAALAAMRGGAVDFSATAVIERAPPALAQTRAGAVEAAAFNVYDADTIRLRASADGAAMVVLSEIYDPGWKATVDGKRVDVFQVDHVLRGIPVPAGDSEIVLRFDPAPLRYGVLLTMIGLAALCAAAAWAAWRAFVRPFPRERVQ